MGFRKCLHFYGENMNFGSGSRRSDIRHELGKQETESNGVLVNLKNI